MLLHVVLCFLLFTSEQLFYLIWWFTIDVRIWDGWQVVVVCLLKYGPDRHVWETWCD